MSKDNKNNFDVFLKSVKYPLISILLSFIIGSFFILLTGNSPLVAYGALFGGSLGSVSAIGETLLKTTPLIFTGLAIAFAFRAGLFNIGAEGQYVMGALFTVSAGYIFRGLPGFILIPLIIFSGALGGALWAAIPGILKAKIGVHEVIVTIMLNYIALFTSNYFIRTLLNPSNVYPGEEIQASSIKIPEQARLTILSDKFSFFGNSSLHTGIFIAIICAIIAYILLFKTTLGYEIRSIGNNPYAGEYGGISVSKNIILSMIISGAFAGLAGATIVAGSAYRINQSSHSAGYGFTGIAVALVGKNHPIGVVAAALLFGILDNGARKMQMAGVPKEVVGIIQGVLIIFIAGEEALKYFENKKKKKALKEVA